MENKVSTGELNIWRISETILSGSCLPDKWEEEDTAEMLVMMENALVNAEEEQKVQVVQEIGSVMQVLYQEFFCDGNRVSIMILLLLTLGCMRIHEDTVKEVKLGKH